MKKIARSSLIAAAAALLSLTSPATAGTLTVDDGPNFVPDTAFTNNTIVIDTTIGEGALVRITGGATVAPTDASNQATIDLSGSFSANATDIFSSAYSFSADLNTETPVNYTITVTITGVPVPITATWYNHAWFARV